MRVNPLSHRDFKGLLLSEIDERILQKDSRHGERMFLRQQTMGHMMKTKQIIRPTTHATPMKYNP